MKDRIYSVHHDTVQRKQFSGVEALSTAAKVAMIVIIQQKQNDGSVCSRYHGDDRWRFVIKHM